MVYNFKDQLTEKNIGLNGANSGALQSIDYQYNLRGWLTNINNVTLNNGGGATNSIMTPTMTGSSPIQNLAITPFINQAVQNAVQPYRGANANALPPINDNNADLFSQNITYENPATQTGATPQYNGNISSTTWQVLGRDKQAYGFKYDGLDRLTEAKYFDITTQGIAPYASIYNTVDKKYDETVTYDIRGNITSLQRNGLNTGSWTSNGYTAATYGTIDNLGYIYVKNSDSQSNMIKSNKLLQVNDFSLADKGFKANNASRASGDEPDYTYDDNGNLTSDRHKYITKISYNYLNLPTLIEFNKPNSQFFGGTIAFIYDATGAKLKKMVTYKPNTNLLPETYDYINGVEYLNNKLQRIPHTEGAVVRNEFGAYEHQYDLRDHLGNTRVTFRDGINYGAAGYNAAWQYVDPNSGNTTGLNDGVITTADIKQINHYYPFGLNMEGNWQGGAQGTNKYQYNGKELNDDFGLGWNDYGARFYDAATARWVAVDPLAESYSKFSPYNYTMNNPIRFIDPDGMGVSGTGKNQNGTTVYDDGIQDGKLYYFDDNSNKKRDKTDGSYLIASGVGKWTKNEKTLDFFKGILTSLGYDATNLGGVTYTESKELASINFAESSGWEKNDISKLSMYVNFLDKPILNLTTNRFNFYDLLLTSTMFHEGRHLKQAAGDYFGIMHGKQTYASPKVYDSTIRLPNEVDAYSAQMSHSTWQSIKAKSSPEAPKIWGWGINLEYINHIEAKSKEYKAACTECKERLEQLEIRLRKN
jgi:RHS repeat-associated protein